jgi:hypothetical protein
MFQGVPIVFKRNELLHGHAPALRTPWLARNGI